MMKYSVSVDTKQIADLDRQFLSGFRKGANDAAKYLEEVVKEEAPTGKSKKLRGGIKGYLEQTASNFTIGVESTAEHTIFVVEGTGIYGKRRRLIRPISAKALRFEGDGGVVFAKFVRGQRPNPFVDRAVAKIESSTRLEETIERGIQI
jgi:hypothetical protein